jgi:hypothetical protein
MDLGLLVVRLGVGLVMAAHGAQKHGLGLAGTFTPAVNAGLLGLGIVGGFANLALRRPTPIAA